MLVPEFIMFLRLIFGLFIDLLIANGFLLPEQREVWTNGYTTIIGAIGAAVLLAIYQYHSHKKDFLREERGVVPEGGTFGRFVNNIKSFIFKDKNTTVTVTQNPDEKSELDVNPEQPAQDPPTSLDEPPPAQ